VVECLRGADGTTLVLADGIGSGVRAHLAAQFTVTRLLEKLRRGVSVRRAFGDAVETLEANRATDMPWAAFSVTRILPEGNATILSYEMPPPLLVSRRQAHVLPQQNLSSGGAVIAQANCVLATGDSIAVMSDGITQAGVGNGLAYGWGADGACADMNLRLSRSVALAGLPAAVEQEACRLAGTEHCDDTTFVLATCRKGLVVSLLTGPPADPARDGEVVRAFLQDEGAKVVCGGTTAGVVAREMDTGAVVDSKSLHAYAPPRYRLDGIDLATEGAICLNQLYNIFDAPGLRFEGKNAVTDLYDLLQSADRVKFIVGKAANPDGNSVHFRQQGILQRRQIVPLLADKLRAADKLVELLWV
jgi:hypothetical protein